MTKLRALGGNIFAGLFTVGVKRAGYEVLGHLEHGPYGVATAQLNHPELVDRVWTHPSEWPQPRTFGKVDLMFCNPPCAAWSSARASKKSSWEDHAARLKIIENLTSYGLDLKPKAWVWESVTNAYRHGRGFIDHIAQAWLQAGYSVTILKQNNMYLGVAQNRPRILVVAHKHPLMLPPLTEPVLFKQAVKGIRVAPRDKRMLAAGMKMLWERAPNLSGNVRRVFDTLTVQEQRAFLKANADTPVPDGHQRFHGKPSFMVSRIDPDRPMNVLLDATKRWHPTEPRLLSWAEMLAVCGLPADWRTTGSYEQGSYELARAVMPPVGEWLAEAVRDGLTRPAIRKPTYSVIHLDAGPEHIAQEELIPAPDPRFEALEWWSDVPPPPTPVRKVGAPRSGGGPRSLGIGAFMRERLAAGDDTETVIAKTKQKFPTSKATGADVSYQRRKLRELNHE